MKARSIRLWIAGSLFSIFAITLIVRAVELQIYRRPFLDGRAADQQLRTISMPAHRGMILDRRGQPIAISTPVDSIWVDPKMVIGNDVNLRPLSQKLGVRYRTLRSELEQDAQGQFLYVARNLPPSDARAILKLRLAGVHASRAYRRYYPSGPVAAPIVGFTNINDRGQYGLELEYNRWLRGSAGAMRVVTSAHGVPVESSELIRAPHPGHNLVTSLDMRIQYLAYAALLHEVRKLGASWGAAVVLDVRTGGILAMASVPSYNPNVMSDRVARLYKNRAVANLFEPGSTFKPFVIAAALATGKWNPHSMINTGNGTLDIGGYLIQDDQELGRITLTTLLEKSSNVGAAKVALSLNSQYLYRVLTGFGFGTLAGGGFPGAQAGRLEFYGHWVPSHQAAISRGYGVSVTALGLARGFMAIADGGIFRPVSFLKRKYPEPGVRVVSRRVAAQLRQMLTTVVSGEGTGFLAEVPNYEVAGKTGTSRLYSARVGGYIPGRYNSVFAGMAPARHPRLVVAVVIQNADHRIKFDGHKLLAFGGLAAAPVFQKIMSASLRLLDIAPDESSVLAGNRVHHHVWKEGPA